MNKLAEICVRRPVFAAVLILTLVVFGAVGYQRLGVDEFPAMDVPLVVVTTVLPGAAAAEIESTVTDKIEGAVNTIGGVEEVRSSSSEGVSQVIVTFEVDRPVDAAAQDVRDKVNMVLPMLPTGVKAPVVSKVDPGSAPILLLALRSSLGADIRELSEVADKEVRRQLESIVGVGQVSIIGARNRQINVWLDPLKLKAYEISAVEVAHALAAENLSVPGGSLEAGPASVSIRVSGRVTSIEGVEGLVVREVNGRTIRLTDVARIEDGIAEAHDAAQLDDEETVVLAIRKQAGKNTVAVVDAIKERLEDVEASLPSGLKLEVIRDNSQVIRTGTDAVLEHLLLGAAFAALVVLMFLGNIRSTLIASVAIPVSIIGTFAFMWLIGYTLNFLTLLALALSVGIVIDDAIVVLENIVRHIEEKGEEPKQAAVAGTKEIALAVLATTLSLLAVFVPLAFAPGSAGKMLGTFGLTMGIAIAVSMFVSFTLTPSLSAHWLKSKADFRAKPSFLTRLVNGFYGPLERAYMAALRWSMQHRWVVMLVAATFLAMAGPLGSLIPKGFVPPDDKAAFEIGIRAPEGTSIEETRLIAERIARNVRRYSGVERALILVASDVQQTENLARIYAYLSDPRERQQSQLDLMDRVRTEVLSVEPKNLRLTVENAQIVSGISTGGVTYALSGPDLDQLTEYATRITNELKKVPGAVDVDNTILPPREEVHARIHREKAAQMGVTVADIAGTLRLFVAGAKASTYADAGEEFEIRLRGDPKYLVDTKLLDLLSIPSQTFGAIPLGAVVELGPGEGPSVINRIARRRQVTISANHAVGTGAQDIQSALLKIVENQNLPTEYRFEPIGETKEAEKLAGSFLTVIILAFALMYLVLAAQFESWLHPFTILSSLPLTVPFALLSLHLLGQTLNIFSGLGLLVLFGVVKKNGILQVDRTNALRAQGIGRLEAILQANKDRFRPIMMTTLSFVAGMIPLAFSKGIGAGFNHATSAIVLGGQTFSLLLTLLAVPVIYSLIDDTAKRFKQIYEEYMRRSRPKNEEVAL
jgi:hydrophobic/amphiphilic exporter-1 (mainly G- bacteria), HAE1 family